MNWHKWPKSIIVISMNRIQTHAHTANSSTCISHIIAHRNNLLIVRYSIVRSFSLIDHPSDCPVSHRSGEVMWPNMYSAFWLQSANCDWTGQPTNQINFCALNAKQFFFWFFRLLLLGFAFRNVNSPRVGFFFWVNLHKSPVAGSNSWIVIRMRFDSARVQQQQKERTKSRAH